MHDASSTWPGPLCTRPRSASTSGESEQLTNINLLAFYRALNQTCMRKELLQKRASYDFINLV
jgi:hypothetical protein